MKNFFNNISLKAVIITGFIVVIFIFAGIGITQYNTLNKIEDIRSVRNSFADAKFKFEEIKYLVTNDIRLIYKLKLTNNEEEVSKIMNEHKKIENAFNETVRNINLKSNNVLFTEEEQIFTQQLKDSLATYIDVYNKSISTSFSQIARYQKMIINPNIIRENKETLLKEKSELALNYKLYWSKKDLTTDKIVTDLTKSYKKDIDLHTRDMEKKYGLLSFSINKLNLGFDKILSEEVKKLDRVSRNSINISWIIFLLGLIVSVLIAVIISQLLINPIEALRDFTKKLAKGELPDFELEESENEVGQMNAAIKDLLEGLKSTSKFASEIGQGNFNHHYTPLGEKDALGNSLLEMRDSLKSAQDEEQKRQVEDQRRSWTSEGLAKFAEILRHHPDNLKELSDEIITELVKYVNANQGGIFILNDSDKEDIHLNLLAAFAYNRKKYISKKIKIGEGLVGAVALEKFSIYMTDVPEEYMEIESGTGGASPNAILIVPLKIEEDVLGVIELASFYKFQEHEIQLVERIAESIASTLATARINTRTAELLEKSQQQANEMKLQEEEMKATIDQLQETQEQSIENEEQLKETLGQMQNLYKELKEKDEKQQIELKKLKQNHKENIERIKEEEKYSQNILQTINSGVIIFNEQGHLEFFNKKAEEIWQYKESEVIGRKVTTLFEIPEGFESVEKYLEEELETINMHGGREFHVITKKGEKERYNISVVKNDKGEGSINYTIFVRDLTLLEQKEKQKTVLMEGLMAQEFENVLKIEYLEKKLKENDIYLPQDDFMPEELIKWTDEYSIGLSIIDGQHQKWITLINKLYTALKDGKAGDEFRGIYKELVEYTEYHFGFEEKYMADTSYESMDSHVTIHRKFVDRIKEYYEDHKNGKLDTTYSLLLYLRGWVKEHITVHDVNYVDLFRKHGLS